MNPRMLAKACLGIVLSLCVTAECPADQPAASSGRSLAIERAEKAARYAARGDTALALSAYTEALRRDPSLGPAWLGLGRLRELLGDSNQAEFAYARAVAITESRVAAFEARAHLRERLGRKDEALADLEAACALEPAVQRLLLLGRRYAARRNWSAALGAYRRIIAEAPPGAPELDGAALEVAALSRLAAETDPVQSGASGRGWIRQALAAAARRSSRRAAAQGLRKLAP